jgi:hypothetical protein
MHIFISHSGPSSLAVAEALRDWLPKVLQSARPWLSSTDIDSGARWSPEIDEQLRKCTAGILCVTPDNVDAPWILFEAGALSKTVAKPLVCPYLIGLEPTDLHAPLALFQARRATREDTLALVTTINASLGEQALSQPTLQETFDVWWPKLAHALENVFTKDGATDTTERRSTRDLIEEVLELIRAQERRYAEEGSVSAAVRALERSVRRSTSGLRFGSMTLPAVGQLSRDAPRLSRGPQLLNRSIMLRPHGSRPVGGMVTYSADELRAMGLEDVADALGGNDLAVSSDPGAEGEPEAK